MNKLELNIIKPTIERGQGSYYHQTERVEILIDGNLLHEIVYEYENKYFGGEDRVTPEYGYTRPIFLLRELGGDWIEEEGATLLGCTCGEEVCASFMFDIKENRDSISWNPLGCVFDNLGDLHYSNFPSLEFERVNYDFEINKIKSIYDKEYI